MLVLRSVDDLEMRIDGLFDSSHDCGRLAAKLGAQKVLVGTVDTFGSRTRLTLRLWVTGKGFHTAAGGSCKSLEDLPDEVLRTLKFLRLTPEAEPKIRPKLKPVNLKPVKDRPVKKPAKPPVDGKELIARLEDTDAGIRFSAAVELGKAKPDGAAEALVRVLRADKDTFVRRAAARSLGEIGDTAAAPALIEAIGDKEFFVAVTAYRALTTISGQDFGFEDGLSAAEMEQVIERAKAWWEKARTR